MERRSGAQRSKRVRAPVARPRQIAAAALGVMGEPVLAHRLPPFCDGRGAPGAVNAQARPPPGPAGAPAPAARPLTAITAGPKRPGAAQAARPAPNSPHGRDGGVTRASRNFVDGERGKPLASRPPRTKQSPRRTVGQPKPRASGHRERANAQEPSHWARTPGDSRPSLSARNWYALARATETQGVPMPSRSVSSSCRSVRRTPSAYLPGKQNQGLSDLTCQQLRAVRGTNGTAHPCIAHQLQQLRDDAADLVSAVADLERVLVRLVRLAGGAP